MDRVAALLLESPMSPQDANLGYRIRSMTSRISELRRMGLPISVESKRTPDGQRYKKYHADRGYITKYRQLKRDGVLNRVSWN